MPSQNQSQHDTKLQDVCAALALPPRAEEVTTSFKKTLAAVTQVEPERILVVPRREEPIISPFIMQLQTKLSLLAGTLVVVLVVGYMTFNQENPYQSFEEVLLEEGSANEFAADEDSFSDLDEDFLSDPTVEGAALEDAPAEAIQAQPSTSQVATVDVTANLAIIDTLFAEDDIDDSSLQTWYSDVSAADSLINQSYDF
jgi:hypothetical protein